MTDVGLDLLDTMAMPASGASAAASAREQTRNVLLRIMQAKQPGLSEHTSHVSQLAVSVGRRLELDPECLGDLARAADLHDIGKVGIPDAILDKPGTLDHEEWDLVRQHTLIGERILSAAPALSPVARIVRASHERWDGGGYPDGLAGEAIPLGARIVAVCDAYDAMISDRCYRASRSPERAREELIREAGHQFDPSVVAAALEVLDDQTAKTPPQPALEHSSNR